MPTLLKVLDRYLLQLEADGRAASTVAQARRHVRSFATWARESGLSGEIGDLSHEDVAAFMAAPVARTRPDGRAKKTSSANALRSSLRGFFRYAHEAGLVEENPARLLRRARCGTGPPRGLTEDEQMRLLAALAAGEGREAARDHALFALMLATGLRLGEALALDVEYVDLEQGEVWIRNGKGNVPGRVYLNDRIREQLGSHLDGRGTGPVFVARFEGRRLSARHARRRFVIWCGRAGIRARAPHALRHSFAMAVYGRTGDLLLTKEALRHRSVVSTMIYAQGREDDLRRAVRG